jgi:hypothetical protein
MESDLARAQKALAAGRLDEARVYAWSALSSAQPGESAELIALARALDDAQLLRELERRGDSTLPPPRPARRRRKRRRIRRLARFLPIAVFGSVVLLGAIASIPLESGTRRPKPADTSAPGRLTQPVLTEHPGVWLVPVGRPKSADIDRLAQELAVRYRLPIGTLPNLALPRWTLDAGEHQLVSQRLVRLLARAYVPHGHAVIIGITDFDMYDEVEDLRDEFSLRAPPHYGVVSTSSLGASLFDRLSGHTRHERTRKLLARIIGFVYYGRGEVDDPHSLLRPQMHGVDDIDDLEEEL